MDESGPTMVVPSFSSNVNPGVAGALVDVSARA